MVDNSHFEFHFKAVADIFWVSTLSDQLTMPCTRRVMNSPDGKGGPNEELQVWTGPAEPISLWVGGVRERLMQWMVRVPLYIWVYRTMVLSCVT